MGLFKKFRDAWFAPMSFDSLDDDFYDRLEESLILADVGMDVALDATEKLRRRAYDDRLLTADQVKGALREILAEKLEVGDSRLDLSTQPSVILVIGVNGVGKTTSIGKLAYQLKKQGKKILLCAGDTFRAAAADQLEIWANRAGVDIVRQNEGADPGAVLFDALTVAHVGEVGVQLPPFRGLERQIDRDVIVFGAVVVDPCQLQQVGILRVGLYRLLNLAADELHAGREGVFVGGHQREVHVLLERRVERRVSRLVGVVRNLHPLGVEAPEARPFDGPGVLGDQRPSFLLRKGEGDVGVWKEREIILSDAFSRRVGVLDRKSVV